VQNLHPLFVHFPIAFLAVFVAGVLVLAVRPHAGLERFVHGCLFVGAAGALLAVTTGFLGVQGVAPVSAARVDLERHQAAGYVVLGTTASLVALVVLRGRFAARPGLFGGARLVGALVLSGALVLTGFEGGKLVYDHGVGTRMTAPGGALHEGTAPAPKKPADAPAPSGTDFR